MQEAEVFGDLAVRSLTIESSVLILASPVPLSAVSPLVSVS